MGAELIAQLILQGLTSLQAMATLQAKAKAEGRDVTVEELKQLRDADGIVRDQLERAIVLHGG
jgi:protein-disulfide isomerase-like protein with CxxC motif